MTSRLSTDRRTLYRRTHHPEQRDLPQRRLDADSHAKVRIPHKMRRLRLFEKRHLHHATAESESGHTVKLALNVGRAASNTKRDFVRRVGLRCVDSWRRILRVGVCASFPSLAATPQPIARRRDDRARHHQRSASGARATERWPSGACSYMPYIRESMLRARNAVARTSSHARSMQSIDRRSTAHSDRRGELRSARSQRRPTWPTRGSEQAVRVRSTWRIVPAQNATGAVDQCASLQSNLVATPLIFTAFAANFATTWNESPPAFALFVAASQSPFSVMFPAASRLQLCVTSSL